MPDTPTPADLAAIAQGPGEPLPWRVEKGDVHLHDLASPRGKLAWGLAEEDAAYLAAAANAAPALPGLVAECQRLREENKALLRALRQVFAVLLPPSDVSGQRMVDEAREVLRAALARGEGES